MPQIYINPTGNADPWSAFRGPDATASTLINNDVPAVTGPRAVPVPSTSKVVGDQEAENLGLYETAKPQSDAWAAFRGAPQPTAPQPAAEQSPSFGDRFSGVDLGARPEMKSPLLDRATQMTQGPETSPMQSALIAQNNILPAAEQGVSPNVDEYRGRLVSNKAFTTDYGGLEYTDPQTGQQTQYNPKTQVALTDPKDNTVKIFDRTDATAENPLTGISRVLAPGLASNAPTPRAAGLVTARAIKPGMVNSTDVLKTSKPLYQQFDMIAPHIPVEDHQAIIDRVKEAALRAGKSKSVIEPVTKVIDEIASKETLADLNELKSSFGSFANSGNSNIRGAAGAATSELRKIIGENLPPKIAAAFNKADAITASGKALQTINQLENVAKTTAGAKVFGESKNDVLRRFMTNIIKGLESKRAPDFSGGYRGLTPDELSAIRDISQGRGWVDKIARTAAAFGPEKGILRTLGEGAAYLHTGGLALAIPALGVAGDILTRILDARKLTLVKDMLAKRSPAHVEAVKNAVDRLQKAQDAMMADPSPGKFGGYIVASRALSKGLTRDGIQITSGDLIKALQGPAKSAAEDNQNPPSQ